MGSATGRHRRPRQAPAIVVAAGVTGSAIAIPLLGAGGAQAADASTWDRVAECESGGMWSADLGNGYYGGLQFSQDTWSAYGGTAYAPRADLASRSQQISVAEKVLDDKGPQAWPSCAVISGLALDGTLPGVDPGGEPSAEPSDTATPSETPSAEPSDTAEPSGTPSSGSKTPSDETDGKAGQDDDADADASPSTTPAPEPSGASGASKGDGATGGKHRGTPAPEGSAGADLEDGRESGRHASRGESGARQGAEDTYTVREGDNLWSIADTQDVDGGWPALYEANKDELGSDPDLILPGQTLDLLGLGSDAQDTPSETAAAN
ncbi:LysM domain-containing protein [Streptomyces sp. LamerLS-316]|uniref:transglycosylase family protein n=1 Tax=unclassified Streptomyces TaxID=2593676 RepID=UPI000823A388|nr:MULTISPECIES: transglycosylase family protein [unclassified Streptomyces]MYQ43337.1 LysM peptidoglycan-binding domain-containing protein [Streptomyces sp. SID4921]SCK20078.1 LysM domain-containing protein [Streptomyces sp. LamerLS-316]